MVGSRLHSRATGMVFGRAKGGSSSDRNAELERRAEGTEGEGVVTNG